MSSVQLVASAEHLQNTCSDGLLIDSSRKSRQSFSCYSITVHRIKNVIKLTSIVDKCIPSSRCFALNHQLNRCQLPSIVKLTSSMDKCTPSNRCSPGIIN